MSPDPRSYKVTLLVADEHRGGPLNPQQMRDFTSTIGSSPGAQWDHPPEVQVVEIAAPGTFTLEPERRALVPPPPRLPVFEFDHDQGAAKIADGSLETVDLHDDGPDSLDVTMASAIEHGVIRRSSDQVVLGVYPVSTSNQQPVLAVGLADGGPLLLDPHEWNWPDEDLEPARFTLALLGWAVDRANELIRDAERRRWPANALLDHVYEGSALRLTCSDGEPTTHAGTFETISGTFHVFCWLPDGRGAIVGNGEQPEQLWRTVDAPERVV